MCVAGWRRREGFEALVKPVHPRSRLQSDRARPGVSAGPGGACLCDGAESGGRGHEPGPRGDGGSVGGSGASRRHPVRGFVFATVIWLLFFNSRVSFWFRRERGGVGWGG